jgi:hypothetical protein
MPSLSFTLLVAAVTKAIDSAFNKAVFFKPNKPKIFKKETIIFVRRPRRIINTAIDRTHHHAVAPVDRSNTMPVHALSFNQSDSPDFDIINFVLVVIFACFRGGAVVVAVNFGSTLHFR